MNGYRVVKVYHLFEEDTEQPVDVFAAVLIFQAMWHDLTKPQRNALRAADRYRSTLRPITLAKLREHQLVDHAGRTTLLGEAVLHYRPKDDDA